MDEDGGQLALQAAQKHDVVVITPNATFVEFLSDGKIFYLRRVIYTQLEFCDGGHASDKMYSSLRHRSASSGMGQWY